jgi:hypothetical protein
MCEISHPRFIGSQLLTLGLLAACLTSLIAYETLPFVGRALWQMAQEALQARSPGAQAPAER